MPYTNPSCGQIPMLVWSRGLSPGERGADHEGRGMDEGGKTRAAGQREEGRWGCLLAAGALGSFGLHRVAAPRGTPC